MQDEEKILTDKELDKAFTTDVLRMYHKEIEKYPNLSVEEQKELGRLYQKNGDLKAKEKLINCNLRLAESIAVRYQPAVKHLKLLDLIQEGNLGLMRAVETYDPEQGAFTTYAIPWIKQTIRRGMTKQEDEIRKPEHIKVAARKYLLLIKEYNQKGLELPSDEEICNTLDISLTTLENIRNSLNQLPVSMNQTVDDGDTELEAFIPAKNYDYDDVLNQIEDNNLFLVLKEILKPLDYFIIYH